MKKLVVVGGTMGSGKSTVCSRLAKLLTPGVWLDGDWCWMMNPFNVTDEAKEMVLDNISHLLGNFLRAPGLDYVLFCWVLQEDAIWEEIARRLPALPYELYRFNLIQSEETLRARLARDVECGARTADVIEKSVARIPLYEVSCAARVITDFLTPQEAVLAILNGLT